MNRASRVVPNEEVVSEAVQNELAQNELAQNELAQNELFVTVVVVTREVEIETRELGNLGGVKSPLGMLRRKNLVARREQTVASGVMVEIRGVGVLGVVGIRTDGIVWNAVAENHVEMRFLHTRSPL
jgi:hypothetical protein